MFSRCSGADTLGPHTDLICLRNVKSSDSPARLAATIMKQPKQYSPATACCVLSKAIVHFVRIKCADRGIGTYLMKKSS